MAKILSCKKNLDRLYKIPAKIYKSNILISPTSIIGMFDTGCEHTIVNKKIFDRLQIPITDRQIEIFGFDGSKKNAEIAIVDLSFDASDTLNNNILTPQIIENYEVLVSSHIEYDVIFGIDITTCINIEILTHGELILKF